MDRAVKQADAVLSAVGHTDTGSNVLTATAEYVVTSMRRHDIDRLVTLVGAGVEAEKDPSSFGRTVMRTVMGWVAGEMLDDAQRHADLIRCTDLNWIVVRPPRLTNGAPTGAWQAGYLTLGPMSILTREDLAEFMLQQVEGDEWVRESPMVAN